MLAACHTHVVETTSLRMSEAFESLQLYMYLCMCCVSSTNIRARRGEREESDCDLLQSGFFVNHHHLALDLELPKVDVDGGSNHIQLVVVVLLY